LAIPRTLETRSDRRVALCLSPPTFHPIPDVQVAIDTSYVPELIVPFLTFTTITERQATVVGHRVGRTINYKPSSNAAHEIDGRPTIHRRIRRSHMFRLDHTRCKCTRQWSARTAQKLADRKLTHRMQHNDAFRRRRPPINRLHAIATTYRTQLSRNT
jgi:hypothetical protein